MAVPKKRIPIRRTRLRRSHLALTRKQVVECKSCGSSKLPHFVCNNCGKYKDIQIITVDKK